MWQVLHANRASRAGLGYRGHHGPSVHYSTAAAAPAAPAVPAAAPGGSRSFCLSRGKLNLQQLNRRLAAYLQQVKCLEATNQRLERQIQEELDRKCPTELRQLDGYLKTTSLLQKQIGGCLSAQAQVKLQLLSAELTVFDFNLRCEKERERRGCLEAELSDLRMLEEVLAVHTLPELRTVLSDQKQQLVELQVQHDQETRGLLAQQSGGVSVEMQSAESSDLTRQLDDLRQTSVKLLDSNQSECWSMAQVSMLGSPEVTFDPAAGSEVVQAELQELRRTAASLEEELTHLQAQNLGLEASGLEQTASFVQQLDVLQQRADGLCGDLDSVLQAAAQQAENHNILLDVKSRLEAEIGEYRRLLDGLNRQGLSHLPSNSAANVKSFCATSSPSAFRRNITVNKKVRVQGGNLRTTGAQTPRQTPAVAPVSNTKSTVQTIRVQSKHPKNSPLRSINTSNLTGSFHKSANQRTVSLPRMTGSESMTISTTITEQSSLVEDKEPQCAATQISQILDKGGVVEASKSKINTAKAINTLVPDTQSARSPVLQEKPETFSPKQVTTGAGSQPTKTEKRIQTEITKTVLTAETEVKQESHFTTCATAPRTETATEVKKETETSSSAQITCAEGSTQAENQEPAEAGPLVLESPAEAARDAGEVAVTESIVSGSHVYQSEEAQGPVSADAAVMKASTPEINTAQTITTSVPDTQPASVAAVQAKPEVFTSTETTAEAGFQANETGTHNQIEITKTILCAEPEVKQGSHFETNKTKADPSTETAAEVKKETETSSSAQITCTEGSIQAENQEPAEAGPLVLSPAEAVRDSGEVAVTESAVSEPDILKPEEAQAEVTLIDDKYPEIEESKGEEEECTLSIVSNHEQKKVTEDADTGSSAEVSKEVEMTERTAINGFHDNTEVKADPTELDQEVVNLAGQEGLLSPTKPKKSVSLTDSGVALSPSDHEEILSPSKENVFMSPSKPITCFSPETCLSPVEAEVLMSLTDKAFRPVDQEERVRSPDSLFSPSDPEMFLSPHDLDTCLSPVEPKGCLSPGAEEEDEACLNLTEAIALVRPVEKYVLSTKEEAQSLSFGRDQGLPEEDRNRKVSISVKDGDSLCFGSFEGNEGSRDTVNGTTINKPTSQGFQPGSSVQSSGGPVSRSVIADKEKQLGFGGLYRKSVRDAKSPRDTYKDTSGTAESKDVQNPGGSPGVRYGFEHKKENSNKPGVFVKAASFDSYQANRGTTVSPVDTNSGGTADSSVSSTADAANTGRFRHGSGDWMFYGGSPGRTSTTIPSKGGEESQSAATLPAASRPETGRFGSRGSGEWVAYGGSLRRKGSLDGGSTLPSEGKKEYPSLVTNPATEPQETGRFGSKGGRDWAAYGGSLGRESSLTRTGREESTGRFGRGGQVVYSCNIKRSDSLPIADSRESQSMAINLPTSPPGTGRFGSRGSGEWSFYGGSSGRMSSAAGSDCPPNAASEESPSVAMQLATSPPGTGRFGSRGSGEWRVYGGSTGRMSRDGSTERVSANNMRVISPPSSYTGSGPRLSSSVVRRSSSVGSGGRLSSSGSGSKLSSSSGSQRASSSGRFTSTGSGEWKPVYSSASGRRSSAGSAGRPAGGGATSSQRAPSPGGKFSGGSGGWLSGLTAGGSRISSSGSGSKVSSGGSSDRISGQAGGRISSSSGSGRTNSTGGRAISSSDRPIRSTGSGAGGNKERISVCKMAALSISAAGRERSQDRRRQQQQQQQAAAAAPLVQRWLTTGVGVTSSEPDGLDDIMRL